MTERTKRIQKLIRELASDRSIPKLDLIDELAEIELVLENCVMDVEESADGEE